MHNPLRRPVRLWAVLAAAACVAAASPVAAQNFRPPFGGVRDTPVTHPPLSLAVLKKQTVSGQTVPFWTREVNSPLDGHTYTTSTVGSNPFSPPLTNTVVPYVAIVVRMHFPNGLVSDPTAPGACDSVPMTTRMFNSPLFTTGTFTSNGVNVSAGVSGGTQFMSAFQRANFWALAQGTQYGVTLVPAGPPVVVDVNAPPRSQVTQAAIRCSGVAGSVPFVIVGGNQYDQIARQLIAAHAAPNQLAIVVSRNMVFGEGSGYHNAIPVSAGTQTYIVASYNDLQISGGSDADIVTLEHEVAEWMNDPFVQAQVPDGGVDDLTPPWGHVGQVGGCQNNLEVGDPLSGTLFTLPGAGGYTYHIQDLAFVDWFYRTPSEAAGGRFSFEGTFTSAQGVCH